MDHDKHTTSPQYTCNDYREEMILLSLQQMLQKENVTDKERMELKREIARIEKKLGF